MCINITYQSWCLSTQIKQIPVSPNKYCLRWEDLLALVVCHTKMRMDAECPLNTIEYQWMLNIEVSPTEKKSRIFFFFRNSINFRARVLCHANMRMDTECPLYTIGYQWGAEHQSIPERKSFLRKSINFRSHAKHKHTEQRRRTNSTSTTRRQWSGKSSSLARAPQCSWSKSSKWTAINISLRGSQMLAPLCNKRSYKVIRRVNHIQSGNALDGATYRVRLSYVNTQDRTGFHVNIATRSWY